MKPGYPAANSFSPPGGLPGASFSRPFSLARLFSFLPRLCLGLLFLFPARGRALDLAEDFVNLQERQYFLRVAIVKDGTFVCAVPHSGFLLHDQEGRILYRGGADTPLRFTCVKQDVIPDVFFYELGAFAHDDKAKAEELAAEARGKLALAVQVLPDPRKDRVPLPDGGMAPPLPWVVAVGPYPQYETAFQDHQKVGIHYRAKIFRALARRSAARIEARDGTGKVIAEAVGYLGIRPGDPGELTRGGWLSPTNKNWHKKTEWEKFNVYHGLMEAWANKNGRLTLVNRVFIEDYLYGVLPAEIGNSVPFEMKKVQAVISRSVAIAKIRMNLHTTWHYDLCALQHCQVYEGALAEHPDTNEAVDATWGQVCVHENNVIDAFFSLSCGGVSANCADAWGGKELPYLINRLDTIERTPVPNFGKYENVEAWVASTPNVLCKPNQPGLPSQAKQAFRWSRTYTADDLARRLTECGYRGIAKVTNIRVARRTTSGLVTVVLIDATPRGAVSIASEHKIRNALGNLPSPFFTLSRTYDKSGRLTKVTIKGAGTGHGVGLCQMGATSLILQGHDYLSVLKHYYEGIDVYRIYR